MSKTANPGFPRGMTAYAGETPDASNLKFGDYLGTLKDFKDEDYTAVGARPLRTTLSVLMRAVRNVSGGAIVPKTVVELSPDYTTIANTTDTAKTPAHLVAVVDEWLPAAGVADDDVCWVVVKGPTKALSNDSGGAIAAGTILITTNDGKVDAQDSSPDDDQEAQDQSQGMIGHVHTTIAQNAGSGLIILRGAI